MVSFLGFCHDLGKNSYEFQEKLKKRGNYRESIRHEVLSVYYLWQLIIRGYSSKKFYKNNVVINEQIFNLFIKDLFGLWKKTDRTYKENKFFLLATVILFHHKYERLFVEEMIYSSEIFREKLRLFYKTFFNPKNVILTDDLTFKFKRPIKGVVKRFGFSLEDVKKEFDALTLPSSFELERLFYILRSRLMLLDHYISQENGEIINGALIANEKQTLEWHLEREKEAGKNMFKKLNESLRYVENFKITPPKAQDRFLWQEEAEKLVKNKKPCFVVVNAETGFGKTIGNLRIINSLNGDKFRVNYLYGLRTLSKQTYSAIKRFTSVKENEIALIISDTSENDLEKSLENTEIPFIKQELKNTKSKALFQVPIVVSTIDYFTNLHKVNKSKYLVALTRLTNSDVIFDEIDQFLEEDQIKILGHIFYVLGMFKRNVIISSATIENTLIEYYFKAYKKGIGNNDFFVGLFNNFSQKIFEGQNFKKKDLLNFLKEKRKYLQKNESFNFKKAKFIKKEDIIESIFKLHEKNNIKINKKKISFGFIKFWSINDLISFFVDNYNRLISHKNYTIKFAVLHSQLGMRYRESLETTLDLYLNRNNREYIRLFIQETENTEKENIIFLLFTTPIIEVGKDLDFDWGITQYQNAISLIQTAGRVYRHRNLKRPRECLNVFLLPEKRRLKDRLYQNFTEEIVLNSNFVYDKFFNEFGKSIKPKIIKAGYDIDYSLNFRSNSENVVFSLKNGKIKESEDKSLIGRKINEFFLQIPEEYWLVKNTKNEDKYIIPLYQGGIEEKLWNKYLGIFNGSIN